MNAKWHIFTVVPAVAMVLALIRARLELNQVKSGSWGCLAFAFFCMFLLATDGRIIPGGPFFSIHGEIIPVGGCLVILWSVGRAFRSASIVRRVGLSLLALFSAGIITLATAINVAFWFEPHARGDLVGW
jgi:hypothetical protein